MKAVYYELFDLVIFSFESDCSESSDINKVKDNRPDFRLESGEIPPKKRKKLKETPDCRLIL